mmetsp:Transcript_143142/g.274988  ORF Transcript_143142/g.274988 Transcript_143142/m.274988 type:complete len:468 (-) Transcript_143142:16-1419(-)
MGVRRFEVPEGLVLKDGTFVRQSSWKEMKMPLHMKGGLIGKNGESINKIQEDSGAIVKLNPCEDDPESVIVHVRGKPLEVDAGFKMIQDRIQAMQAPGYKWDVKVIEVPKALIGETIGPGGMNLHRFAAESECKMKFIQASEIDETAQPGKQVCVIRGPPEKMLIAEKLLQARVEEVQAIHMKKLMKGTNTHVDKQSSQILDQLDSVELDLTIPNFMPGGGKSLAAVQQTLSEYSEQHQSKIPCKFHMRIPGSCKNGAACYFSHDPEVVAAAQGVTFLNDEEENSPDFKTIYCKFFDSGKCTRGAACFYAHGVEELRGGMTPRNMHIMQEAKLIAEKEEQLKQERAQWRAAASDAWQSWQDSSWDDSSFWGDSGAWGQSQPSQPEARANIPAAFRPREQPKEEPQAEPLANVPAAFRAGAKNVPAAFRTDSFKSRVALRTGAKAFPVRGSPVPVLSPMASEVAQQFY